MGIRIAIVAMCLLLLGACGAAVLSNPSVDDRADDGIVLVISPVIDAEVWVDGQKINRIARLGGGLQLAPGTYRFEVRHLDYFTYYQTLVVKKNERLRLEVTLAKVLP